MTYQVRPFVRFYDRIYSDKNYEHDIAIFSTLAELDRRPRQKYLEIGAGTGNHTLRLSGLATLLVSIETDHDFAEILKSKIRERGLRNVKIESLPLDKIRDGDFDAACALFHVLNYVRRTEMARFAEALAARLLPGAWFVADLWNCEAVYLDPPRRETRQKFLSNGTVVQTIEPVFDRKAGTVRLSYDIGIATATEQFAFRENLDVNLWRRDELMDAFAKVGFEISFHDYADLAQHPGDRSVRQWLSARKY